MANIKYDEFRSVDTDSFEKLVGETYHDLLWVLALMLGSKPPSKQWGIVSQFIGLYRSVLIEVGEIKAEKEK